MPFDLNSSSSFSTETLSLLTQVKCASGSTPSDFTFSAIIAVLLASVPPATYVTEI